MARYRGGKSSYGEDNSQSGYGRKGSGKFGKSSFKRKRGNSKQQGAYYMNRGGYRM